MPGIARAVLAAALLNCGLASAADAGEQGQWLKDGACALFGADARPGDTVRWTGSCIDGYAEGLGTATFTHDGQPQSFTATFVHGVIPDGHVISRWGQGWSYDGEAVAGRFQGAGILTTEASDRFDGQWTNGRMSGFGVLLRANGERYAGDWKDDKPNGNGELRRADGTLVSGVFVDGKLAQAGTAIKPAAGIDRSTAVPFGGVSGQTLTGVDGSSIALTLIEGGMELQLVPVDGSPRKTTFTFMTDRMGTVVEDSSQSAGSSVTGFFRLTGKGVEVRYADGRSAMLSASADGGVQMALEGDTGPACRAWYPQGHQFSDSDKKIALNAYASKLGLPVAAADNAGCSSAPAPQATNAVPSLDAPPAAAPAARPRPERHSDSKTSARMAKASYRIGDYQPNAETPVKNSAVHAIDAPQTMSVASAIQTAPVVAVATPDRNNASQCLKVDSDGSHWGFRNSCDFAVQFAYCMAGGSNSLTACGANKTITTSATGSVAAKGFGALETDTSLQDKDASHNFRWIACGGGSGEVVAHLDTIEPPAGRCERTRTASAN